MKITKATILLVTSMIIISIFIAYIINLLNTDEVYAKIHTKDDVIKISDNEEPLLWFLQISDIHISIFQDHTRITQFREFCDKTIDAIRPAVVLASGDLTDAKTKEGIGSQQFEKEWQYYRDIITQTMANTKTVWLDIRGNHDNFNVATPNSTQNYFLKYSIQGQKNPKSYMFQYNKGNAVYSFIGIDACLEPGPRRPFNFIGIIDPPEVEQLNRLIRRAYGSNYTIWFGHFPTSCILSTGYEEARTLIAKDPKSIVYVCGHLHKLGGLIPQMYTLQKNGFLELELGDWKDNRVYRLMAIDHGMFSFIDLNHNEWPIALITNPKHKLFYNPTKENIDNIRTSTHIRVLAFSLSKIKSVKVRINQNKWIDCENVKGPLYVAKWDPNLYIKGLHQIEVNVEDIDGRVKNYEQPFALDDSRLHFGVLSRLALMTSVSSVFRILFGIMLFISIVPLALLRLIHRMVGAEKLPRPRPKRRCLNLWLRKFWVLATVDRIFWPVILYPVYLTIGPWCIGYIVEDYLGVIFAWGIFVNGYFLPGSFTYAYGFIQLPLTFVLAHGVDHRFQLKVLYPEKSKTIGSRIALHLPFFIVFGIQTIMAYLFWIAYGTLAFIFGPLRTWSVILAGILWWNAIYLPEKCTQKAAAIWRPPERTENQ